MTSRMPNDDNDDTLRPMLGWDQALAVLQRNLMQQQQQQQQQQQPQQQQPPNHNPLNQAAVAALAAGLAPPTSLANASLPLLWPYNLGTAGIIPPAAAAAAASLASLGNPSNSYLNHLQQSNPHNPESLVALQQNLLLLEQIQQQRQLLAANPHLLMALNAAQGSGDGLGSPRTQMANSLANATANTHHNHQQQHHHQLNGTNTNQQLPANLLQGHRLANLNGGPKLSNSNNNNNSASPNSLDSASSNSGSSINHHGSNSHNNSLLTTVNSLTNQHQDSLVDQHFRRSLGEDYNQIMSTKADKINAGK